MKIYLPDINFWLALALDTNAQHPSARDWLAGLPDDRLAFCRVTQSGFLRLMTNTKAFPHDAVSMAEAWLLYDRILADRRMTFEPEPHGIEPAWRAMTQRVSRSPHVWADAYLAAFASVAGYEVVTFDRGFAQFKLDRCTILP